MSAVLCRRRADDTGLGKNVYANLIHGAGDFRFIGAYGQNRDAAVYRVIRDGELVERDWDNRLLGVKHALTNGSELLPAWNQRRHDTERDHFNTVNANTLNVGLDAKLGY